MARRASTIQREYETHARRLDAPRALVGAASSLLATLPSDATVPNVTDEVVVGVADDVAAALMKDQVPGQAADAVRGAGLAEDGAHEAGVLGALAPASASPGGGARGPRPARAVRARRSVEDSQFVEALAADTVPTGSASKPSPLK